MVNHGRYSTYVNSGCRCTECREAMRAYHYAYTQERKARIDPGDPRHGTNNFYTNHGCRCASCREARRHAAMRGVAR